MIKVYHKTTTIKAEQFDGSDEMAKRYGAELYSESGYGYDAVEGEPDGDGYVLITSEGESLVLTGDWITTDVFGRHEIISDNKFRRQHIKLPVISKEVADWIELGKSKGMSLDTALMILMAGRTESPDITGVSKWIWHYHMADIAIAWTVGYELEDCK